MATALREPSLGIPVLASLILHAGIVGLVIASRTSTPPQPPLYRVRMIAAPPGPRASGVVQPAPATPAPAEETPTRAQRDVVPVPSTTRTPVSAPQRATPTPTPTTVVPNTPAPTAGGGATGGTGTDVANVSTSGIDFPFPGYLENIVRQVARHFQPGRGGALKAEVAFIIRRDGSVLPSSIRLVQRSGVYSFDIEALGAVEAAANARAFGPLPSAFPDDALPVVFSFDPRVIR